MSKWIDYKQLRERLDFAAVLEHYGVELKRKGKTDGQHQGLCPLPTHPQKAGKKRTASFSANLVKGIWQCFGCGAKGNVIDFAALMEGLNPKEKEDFRKAALMLNERRGSATTPTDDAKPRAAPKADADKAKPKVNRTPAAVQDKNASSDGGEAPKRVVINAPLDFELKTLDAEHPVVLARASKETIAHFGLGYCSRGLMKGRIAIPLYDASATLIGYAGRLADDAAIDENTPKYLFPSRRERRGVVYEFRKSLFVYNGDGIERPVGDLIVVEGFHSVWWLWQNGYQNVVGLMGASCSSEQADIIVGLVKKIGAVWVFPDGDDAGERCAMSVLQQVAPRRYVRWAKPKSGKQPTDYSRDDLTALLLGDGRVFS